MGTEIASLLQEATKFLKKSGIPSPRTEAELLLAYVWPQERIFFWSHSQDNVPTEVEHRFKASVRQRSKKFPLAYIIGKKEFYGYDFFVTPQVLIPRPETELLIDLAVSWLGKNEKLRIVDLGTGSGALAVTLARLFPQAQVWAVDLCAEVLSVAQKNALHHGVQKRVNFRQGNFWEALPGPPGASPCIDQSKFDLVVSNPPYITTSEMCALPEDVGSYEPTQALHGGADGLKAYRTILRDLPAYLKSSSLTLLEISPTVSRKVYELCGERFMCVKIIADYGGKDRVLQLSNRDE